MNERTNSRTFDRGASGRTGASPSGRRPWLWVGIGLVGLLVVGLVVGTAMAGSIVRSRLELLAKDAGLTLQLDDVAVRPTGKVALKGLALKRPDGTPVLAVQDAEAVLSPWRLLMGRKRPTRLDVHGFQLDVLFEDGKPRELLELYKAARKQLPKKTGDDEEKEKKQDLGSALMVDKGALTIRVKGKGAQYLPQGLKVRDIALRVDLAHGLGDASAVVEGTVASKLTASLENQKDGPPRLQARFVPEFRLKVPADAPLPLGIDSLAVAGLRFDASEGGAIEDVVLRKGEQTLLSIKHVRPTRSGAVGIAAETIAFAVPEPAHDQPGAKGKDGKDKDGKPAKDKGKDVAKPAAQGTPGGAAEPMQARVWNGTAERLTLGLDGLEGGEIPLVLRLEAAKVMIPGDVGILGVQAVELRTDRLPGEHPLEALTQLHIEQPSVDLPWRQAALEQVPGGRQVWSAVTAAEQAKLRAKLEDEVEDEIDDPTLPPEARRKKVEEKVNERMRAAGIGKDDEPVAGAKGKPGAKKPGAAAAGDKKQAGAASRSWVATQVGPLKDLHGRLLSVDEALQKVIEKAAQAPRLKVTVKGGRIGLVKPDAQKPFGGVQDIEVQWTAVQGDGTRGLLLGAKPFDDERTWGEIKADLVSGPGPRLERAKFQIAGGHFAQALRIVSSAVAVAPDSDLKVDLEVRTGKAVGTELTLTGDLKVHKVGFDWWRLAPKPIENLTASAKLNVAVTKADMSMRAKLEPLQVGDATMTLQLEATDLASKPTVHVRAEMPKQDCGKVAASIPPAMITSIGSIQASGEISWLVDLTVPLQNVYKADLKLDMDDTTCDVTGFTGLDVLELTQEFSRPVNENGTLLEEVEVGPSSGAWVPLNELKPWTPWAMIATEDGAFYKHRGLRPGLLLRAIRLDLDYGRFVYGGSTITQQLVKNIYLTRAKNLSRKFEELLIVWQMERAFVKALNVPGEKGNKAKDRILELYVNFIEFGPKIYGVQRAAQTYFGKDARELTPLESAFLAANKPCPRCGYARFAGKKWDPWWQERMLGIMTKMRDEGIIGEEQFLAEAPYVPKFLGWPAPAAPQPGAPLAGVEE